MGAEFEFHAEGGRRSELMLELFQDGRWMARFRIDGRQEVTSTTTLDRRLAIQWGELMLRRAFPDHACGPECQLIARTEDERIH